MHDEIGNIVKKIYLIADVVWAKAHRDQLENNLFIKHAKDVEIQIKKVNDAIDLLNQSSNQHFDLDETVLKMQVLGYRLYRMQWDIVHAY